MDANTSMSTWVFSSKFLLQLWDYSRCFIFCSFVFLLKLICGILWVWVLSWKTRCCSESYAYFIGTLAFKVSQILWHGGQSAVHALTTLSSSSHQGMTVISLYEQSHDLFSSWRPEVWEIRFWEISEAWPKHVTDDIYIPRLIKNWFLVSVHWIPVFFPDFQPSTAE